MKPWIIILIVVVAVLLIGGLIYFLIYSDVQMTKQVLYPKFNDRKEQIRDYHYDEVEEYFCLKREPFEVTLKDGYVIHGDYSENEKPSNKYVILVHGHGSTREGTLKYCPIFYQMGYNIIRYDHRSHGDNERGRCTMGHQEAKDLNEIIDYVKERFGKDIFLVLHGTSLGGATVLLLTQYRQDINYIVADCPYASMIAFAGDYVHNMHLMYWPFKIFFPIVVKTMSGLKVKDMAPIEVIDKNKIPTLHLHGAKDTLIRPYHCQKLYDKNGAEKEIHFFPNSPHGQSAVVDRKEYEEVLQEFAQKYEKRL